MNKILIKYFKIIIILSLFSIGITKKIFGQTHFWPLYPCHDEKIISNFCSYRPSYPDHPIAHIHDGIDIPAKEIKHDIFASSKGFVDSIQYKNMQDDYVSFFDDYDVLFMHIGFWLWTPYYNVNGIKNNGYIGIEQKGDKICFDITYPQRYKCPPEEPYFYLGIVDEERTKFPISNELFYTFDYTPPGLAGDHLHVSIRELILSDRNYLVPDKSNNRISVNPLNYFNSPSHSDQDKPIMNFVWLKPESGSDILQLKTPDKDVKISFETVNGYKKRFFSKCCRIIE